MMDGIFGEHSLTRESYDFIRSVLPEGSVLLELGSGRVTELFTQYYTVWSVEDDLAWVDATESNYIYAPLVDDKWYDVDILKQSLPDKYDFLLVDGPRTSMRRSHFVDNMSLFRDDVIWFFDDVNRSGDAETFQRVISNTNRRHEIRTFGAKMGGIIYGVAS